MSIVWQHQKKFAFFQDAFRLWIACPFALIWAFWAWNEQCSIARHFVFFEKYCRNMLNFFCPAVSKNAYFCLFCVYIFSQGIQHFLDLTKNMQNFGKFLKIFSFCRIPLNKISFPAANAEAKYWFITLFSNLNEVKILQKLHDFSIFSSFYARKWNVKWGKLLVFASEIWQLFSNNPSKLELSPHFMQLVSINKYGNDVFLIVLHFSNGHEMMIILEESWKFCNVFTSFRLENKVMNQYLASALGTVQ